MAIHPTALVEPGAQVDPTCEIGPYAVIGEIPQDLKYRGEPTALVIGDKNTFRESVTINLGTVQGGGVTTIGNGCLFMAYSHVGHDCRIAGGAMDVPPYCTVAGTRAELAGLNTVGLQRAGMTEEQVGRVKQLYKIVFRSNLGLAEALAQVEAELGSHPEIDHFVAFVKASQRGITR